MKLSLLNHAKPILSFFQNHGYSKRMCWQVMDFHPLHPLSSMVDNDSASTRSSFTNLDGCSLQKCQMKGLIHKLVNIFNSSSLARGETHVRLMILMSFAQRNYFQAPTYHGKMLCLSISCCSNSNTLQIPRYCRTHQPVAHLLGSMFVDTYIYMQNRCVCRHTYILYTQVFHRIFLLNEYIT